MLSLKGRKSARAGFAPRSWPGRPSPSSALSAGSAAAAPSCTGSNITGRGSSLQKIAEQNVWAPSFHTERLQLGYRTDRHL